MRDVQFLRLDPREIEFGKNVRIDEQGMDRLEESIRQHGVLQPITVVQTEDGLGVECLFGHRRLTAALRVRLPTIPCFARERGSEQSRVLTQLAENKDRMAMSPVEEGRAYRDLRDLGMSQQQIGAAVGVSQPTVSMRLLILDYPEIVQLAVHRRTIGINDALAIPIELAKRTDGRTMASVMRRGGRHVRGWVRAQQKATEDAGGTMERRVRYSTVNIDSDLVDDMAAAARLAHVKQAEFVRRAIRAEIARVHAARTSA